MEDVCTEIGIGAIVVPAAKNATSKNHPKDILRDKNHPYGIVIRILKIMLPCNCLVQCAYQIFVNQEMGRKLELEELKKISYNTFKISQCKVPNLLAIPTITLSWLPFGTCPTLPLLPSGVRATTCLIFSSTATWPSKLKGSKSNGWLYYTVNKVYATI